MPKVLSLHRKYKFVNIADLVDIRRYSPLCKPSLAPPEGFGQGLYAVIAYFKLFLFSVGLSITLKGKKLKTKITFIWYVKF